MVTKVPDDHDEPDASDIPAVPESSKFDKMGYDRSQRCLYGELTNVLNHFCQEFELTPINVVGVLEGLKHDVFTRALEEQEEEDDT